MPSTEVSTPSFQAQGASLNSMPPPRPVVPHPAAKVTPATSDAPKPANSMMPPPAMLTSRPATAPSVMKAPTAAGVVNPFRAQLGATMSAPRPVFRADPFAGVAKALFTSPPPAARTVASAPKLPAHATSAATVPHQHPPAKSQPQQLLHTTSLPIQTKRVTFDVVIPCVLHSELQTNVSHAAILHRSQELQVPSGWQATLSKTATPLTLRMGTVRNSRVSAPAVSNRTQ
jgi:hypothetical protein